MKHTKDQIDEILIRGVVNIIPSKDALKKKLTESGKLNIYLGIDPTATKLHIGHSVPLRKLNAFAQMGHNVTFLIGDFTALIGDTSDKDKERPVLTYKEIKNNFKLYKKQAEKVVDFSKVKVVHNSSWLKKLKFADIIKLCQHFSVGDFVGRTLIRKRLDDGKKVGLHETLYPVMQGYDSYHLDTDIQIGAADQTFNMQAGRSLLKDLKNKNSFVLVTDYLAGTDGRKMSKSEGNAIWMDDTPDDMYAKLMAVNDNVVYSYYILATNLDLDFVLNDVKKLIKKDPLTAKKQLAFVITTEFHGEEKAEKAREHFEKTFNRGKPTYDIVAENMGTIANTIAPYNSLASISESKRLIRNGAVEINGKVINNPNFKTVSGQKIKVGKKTFIKVK